MYRLSSNIIKYLFLGFLILLPASVYSQSDGNQSSVRLNVNAEVVGSMEIITMRNIQLGEVQPSQQMLQISPIRDIESGKMKISGAPGATVRISYNQQMALQQIDGNNEVMFNYEIAGNNVDDQATADLFDFRNQQAQLNGDGEYFLWIGGSMPLERIEPGRYESDFTIEVDYL